MLGSHNSYTGYEAVNKSVYNYFTKFWRCQTKSIQEQYKAGVRFFDIRVCAETVNVGGKDKVMWRSCHGLVNVDNLFTTLSVCCKQFQSLGSDVKIRILLEKGNASDVTLFKNESEKVLKKYSGIITQIVIKDNWQVLYEDWKGLEVIDYCYIPWNSSKSWWYNVTHFTGSTIASWAKKHNPVINDIIINDKNVIHFMDCI